MVQRAVRGKPAFVDASDAALYRDSLRSASRDAQVDIHAYALWSDEVRLLATPRSALGLADAMQAVGRRYVRGFNLRHGHSGSPWDGRFRSTVVDAEYFLLCVRFVEAPAGTEGDPACEPLASSRGHHEGLVADPLVSEHPTFWSLGNTPFDRESACRRLLRPPLSDREVASILHASLHGWVLGSADFARAVEKDSGRRTRPGQAGRPRRAVPG